MVLKTRSHMLSGTPRTLWELAREEADTFTNDAHPYIAIANELQLTDVTLNHYVRAGAIIKRPMMNACGVGGAGVSPSQT